MRTATFLALAASLVLFASASLAQQPKGPPKALERYEQFRAIMSEGRYDLAATYLKAFIADNPTDAELKALQAKYGNTVFQALRGVRKWSDDAAAEKAARANVETLVNRVRAIEDRELKNETRVKRYTFNLGSKDRDERLFAEQELKRTGTYAIPIMVEILRSKPDPAVAAGIFLVIRQLDPATVGGWLTATDAMEEGQQYAVLAAIVEREDRLALLNAAQTDYRPYLWRVLARTRGGPASEFRRFATAVLNPLGYNPADERRPEEELVAVARTFFDHKAKFARQTQNPNESPNVPVWLWDTAANRLAEPREVPLLQAEEYFGLRYGRWALEANPRYEPAQTLVLALAAERAVERGKFGHLARTDPTVYQLLADAPPAVLLDLLRQGLNQKRTALVLGVVQVLGDRAGPEGGGPRPTDPSKPVPPSVAKAPDPLLVKALFYGDPRVQLAAANAMLRSPNRVDARLFPEVPGQILNILRRAVNGDPVAPPPGLKGQALLADPSKLRSDSVAAVLRSLGYETEVFTTGRDLERRIARASDFDLIVIDHHIVAPQVFDLVAHLRADANAARRPILVIASANQIPQPTLDMLVLRMALLIATTETEAVVMDPPFVPNIARPVEEQEAERRTLQTHRDATFRNAVGPRLARLKRVIEGSGLELTRLQRERLELNAELMTYAALGAEFPLTPESSPGTVEYLANLRRRIDRFPATRAYTSSIGIPELTARIERLELDIARVPTVQKRYDALRGRVDAADLGLRVATTRDPVAEARLTRALREFGRVKVIPEPFSRVGFEDDVKTAFADPAAAPRDPAEKQEAARLAISWLRRMATGEVSGFAITASRDTERVLRDALRVPELADPAIDAVAEFGTGESEQALLELAMTIDKQRQGLRLKAADAVIRHAQQFGNQGNAKKWIPQPLIDALKAAAEREPNPDLRGKFIILNGLLAATPTDFVQGLLGYQPSILRPMPTPPTTPPPAGKGDPKKQ